MKQSTKGVLYIRGLPTELKLAFRSYCVRRNTTMTDVIAEMMRQKIKEDTRGISRNPAKT